MNDQYFYEQLIYSAIADAMRLELTSLRLFPTIFSLPHDDRELFNLFDIIPSSEPLFEINENVPRFSSTYEALLQSQPDSYMVKIAKQNFENPDNWLPADLPGGLPKTPLYSPNSADISNSVAGGSLFNFTLDSQKYPAPSNILLYPSFPSFVVNESFRIFNQIAEGKRFVFKLSFEKIATPTIRAGGWFNQGVFTQAFKSNGNGWLTGPGTVTWDSLFGNDGILKYICNRILAVSGMMLELHSFGHYNSDMLNALRSNKATSIWPFYLNVENLIQEYVLGTDGSIKITSKVPSSEILLLVMGTASVDSLVGNVA
ncbi:hypothetical protein JYQ62_03915 [Nostoc sp. UHCC 0702]|nr:hypothetical protein JYQ62_03915 [Nostoc sp. UHCC 0702]